MMAAEGSKGRPELKGHLVAQDNAGKLVSQVHLGSMVLQE